MRVVVLTTSYPRPGFEHSGRFIEDAVTLLRARGVEMEVVGPGIYRTFGLTEGGGVMHEVRRRPWAGPLLVGSMALAVRRTVARTGADLVHAHWLPTAVAAYLARVPYVVTLHGTDLVVAQRSRHVARRLLRGARAVIAVSNALAEEARRLGAREVTVIPNGIRIPEAAGVEANPPYVLFAGRLAPEKGLEEFVAATRGLNVVVAGDGPLRELAPDALGFVPREEYERIVAGAAVLAFPSRREGFGVSCAEGMAFGRPVVASAVGGLLDLVRDGETGLLVPPRDPVALRAALDRLLADRALRDRLGAAAREHVRELCDWNRISEETLAVYRRALA